ncbi:MAG: imidazole glycerol phosphate synthase subunit HisH [Alphaproteobacteria bacterium]|nr:imidazole glycerol phosphate synthase subunit HisH [Alphaproteobacteria bacterium]
MSKIGIINPGYGNIYSIQNMLHHAGIMSKIIEAPVEVKEVEKVILPGVGAFDNCMHQYASQGFVEEILNHTHKGKHVLGICAGAQILGKSSEEGTAQGIGLLPFINVRFKQDYGLPIPHMGWSSLLITQHNHPLFRDISQQQNRFYFVHSFHFQVEMRQHVLASSKYGYEFPSIVAKDNVMAVQFHPEKSQKHGIQFLKNFCELND